MSETLLGVVVGGFLTGIGTLITTYLHHKKWKIEQRINILETRKERLEELSQKTLNKIHEGMSKNSYDTNMISDIDFLFPENVFKAFNTFMDEAIKSDQDDNVKKNAYYIIAREMKKAIKNIDDEIDIMLK